MYRSSRQFGLAFVLAAAILTVTAAPAFAAGSAVTEPAAKIHHTTAVLNGHLDPEGDPGITGCKFEWGETPAYGNTAPCAEGNSFNGPAEISALLSGLSPAVTYHFRLHIETTSNGPFDGADRSFRTIPVPSEHPLIVSFGSDGTSGSSFSGFRVSPTVHQATKRLYVANSGRESDDPSWLYGFDASSPLAFSPLGEFPISIKRSTDYVMPMTVDNTGLGSAGNVYFLSEKPGSTENELYGVNSSGAILAGFPIDISAVGQDAKGIAVNSNGEVWVASAFPAPGKILKYSSSGAFLGSFSFSPFPGSPAGAAHRIAFDSEDNLYVTLYIGYNKAIWKFTAASGYASATRLPDPPNLPLGIAIDPSTDYLYVNSFSADLDKSTIAIYDTTSSMLFDEFEVGGTRGVAVDAVDHAIYVSNDNGKVDVYATGAPLSPPTATTALASAITGSKATLNGFVDPEGQSVTECKFEYGLSTFYDKTAPCSSSPGSGSGDVAVSAEVTGLTPNTTYHYRLVATNASATAKGEDEALTTNPPPVISLPEVASLGHNSAQLKAQVNPKGYETTYHFEYGTTTAYGTKVPIPDENIGSGTSEVPVSANIAGLSPDTVYHWRVVAENVNGIVNMADQTFTTFGPAKAETTGSPIRTATTAQLQARVNPDGAPTTYRFEYGAQGSCDANPCTATPDRSAGSAGVYRFVAEQVEGLEPDTTYHYRVIAESPTPGGPAIGEDMTVTTRASDAPLSHGRFPGPPGSDRAYEQVSPPDTGGNPVGWAFSISTDGNRAFYKINGGTPISKTGTLLTMLYSERTPSGWRSEDSSPPRDQLVGAVWVEPRGLPDLSNQIAMNVNSTDARMALWRMRPGQVPTEVFTPPTGVSANPAIVSEDASRILVRMKGSHDPAHPSPPGFSNLYDVSSGTPELVSLLPDGSVPSCEVIAGTGATSEFAPSAKHWVTPDGTLAFFQTCQDLYVRDLVADETKLIGEASFVKWTPNGVFLSTNQSLAPNDTGGGDLYRYDLGDESLECVTCVVPGLNANPVWMPISADGSRVYFTSSTELIRGAETPAIYRVEVDSGELAYVAPGSVIGEEPSVGGALTSDGSALVFRDDGAGLNALGGQQNGATLQYYRYDDRDRSLTCLSCPQDGSAPENGIEQSLVSFPIEVGANRTALSANGQTFAFATNNALLLADQNTARAGQKAGVGADVYEWRDGRLLLVTDGLGEWPDGSGPQVSAITPSGSDIFFTAAAQYTKDALDGYLRLYTARIGGGFEFPAPPKPCPLEVCQGTPKGAPEEQEPGTGSFSGSGNVSTTRGRRPCPKGRHKARKGGKTRCVKSHGKKPKDRRRNRP